MRLEMTKSDIGVRPESAADELFIERVLGLMRHQDQIALVRESIDAPDGSSIIVRLSARRDRG
jgi:hypothetical protein